MTQQTIFDGCVTSAVNQNFTELYSNSQAPINVTASTTLTKVTNGGKIMVINAAAGLTLTLPAATGLGTVYSFFIGTTITSNNVIIQAANSTDILQGYSDQVGAAGAETGFQAGATDDTLTLNGSTKGGFIGDQISVRDVMAGVFQIASHTKITGTAATPFSAAV